MNFFFDEHPFGRARDGIPADLLEYPAASWMREHVAESDKAQYLAVIK
jgi:hypothetical protein